VGPILNLNLPLHAANVFLLNVFTSLEQFRYNDKIKKILKIASVWNDSSSSGESRVSQNSLEYLRATVPAALIRVSSVSFCSFLASHSEPLAFFRCVSAIQSCMGTDICTHPRPCISRPRPHPSPQTTVPIPIPTSDKDRKVESERMRSAAGDMKQSYCNSFLHFHIRTFAVRYIRGLSSPLPRFYRNLRHRSRGTTVNGLFPSSQITAVFVIIFNPITAAILPRLPAVLPSSPSHAAL